MAKCSQCGKSGIFFRVESSGFCKNCERIKNLEADEHRLRSSIEELNNKYVFFSESVEHIIKKRDSLAEEMSDSIKNINEKRDAIFQEISDAAKKAAFEEIVSKIAQEQSRLTAVTSAADEMTLKLDALQSDEIKLNKSIVLAANKLKRIQSVFKSLQFSVSRHQSSDDLNGSIISEEMSKEADDILETTVKMKFHLMDIRELRKSYQQNEKARSELLATYHSRYTTKTNSTIYKLMVIALEAELQNVLYNLSYAKLDKSIKDIKSITSKYQKIASDGNQIIAPTIAKFVGQLEYLFIEAVNIEYEYYIQKERIKEEQRMLREQIRQEAAEKKVLEEQRRKVEKEESKYKSELDQIAVLITQTTDQNRIQQLQERVEKVQEQLEEVEQKKDSIINLQNGKAGYIYIISNLGSFGEKVFKIGMTRRLDPQSRVDELGDASVPFRFDVHSFIFSNSAPELETALHKRLHNQRVNKVNLRKEFFTCTIDELENLVYELEPTAVFNRTMMAEQFNQSMSIDFIPESVETEFSEENEELEEEIA